jgi:phosphatidylserine decarboxylase
VIARPARVGLLVAGLLAAAGLLALWRAEGYGPPSPGGLALAVVTGGAWLFFASFFRDPERAVGPEIVSAADGRVAVLAREGDRWRIGVFMNVTDVHVNRFPLDAVVERIVPSGRGHRPAYRAEASHNVQRSYELSSAIGPVSVVQMTGIFARRIVPYVGEGHRARKGDRLGLIAFGSRVDVLLPADRAEPVVRLGDRARAGVTPIARERNT